MTDRRRRLVHHKDPRRTVAHDVVALNDGYAVLADDAVVVLDDVVAEDPEPAGVDKVDAFSLGPEYLVFDDDTVDRVQSSQSDVDLDIFCYLIALNDRTRTFDQENPVLQVPHQLVLENVHVRLLLHHYPCLPVVGDPVIVVDLSKIVEARTQNSTEFAASDAVVPLYAGVIPEFLVGGGGYSVGCAALDMVVRNQRLTADGLDPQVALLYAVFADLRLAADSYSDACSRKGDGVAEDSRLKVLSEEHNSVLFYVAKIIGHDKALSGMLSPDQRTAPGMVFDLALSDRNFTQVAHQSDGVELSTSLYQTFGNVDGTVLRDDDRGKRGLLLLVEVVEEEGAVPNDDVASFDEEDRVFLLVKREFIKVLKVRVVAFFNLRVRLAERSKNLFCVPQQLLQHLGPVCSSVADLDPPNLAFFLALVVDDDGRVPVNEKDDVRLV